MRLFIGLRPGEEFRTALCLLQDRLRAAGVMAGYLAPSNLHMTLAFIGEWPENIAGLLPPVDRPFTLRLSRAGLFPEAKVVWAGVEPSEALDDLARRVRGRLEDAGIPFDRKPFVPHITLGRKPFVPPGLDLEKIAAPPARMTVTEVCLYRSAREMSGMVYTVIGQSAGRRDKMPIACREGEA